MSAETGQPRSAAVSGPVRLGLRENWPQFALLVVVNVFVGGMVGLERTTTSLVFSEGADMLNEVAGIPDVTFGLHLCRGNYDSDWISSGTYETISKQLFRRAANYDVLLLEFDDERSGSFSALSDIPDDKVVVLGLVSSKFGTMEPADQLAARIREASGFFPREQLALSTQCGFASAGPGNAISESAQENKLRLVAEVADRIWRPAADRSLPLPGRIVSGVSGRRPLVSPG